MDEKGAREVTGLVQGRTARSRGAEFGIQARSTLNPGEGKTGRDVAAQAPAHVVQLTITAASCSLHPAPGNTRGPDLSLPRLERRS